MLFFTVFSIIKRGAIQEIEAVSQITDIYKQNSALREKIIRMTNILFAASECVPFIKTGGLGDVVGSLPKYFPKDILDARVILPLYDFIEEKYRKDMKKAGEFTVVFRGGNVQASVYELNYKGVIYYFVAAGGFFAGEVPYAGMPGDIDKFVFFDKALLAALKVVEFRPDIIHCHDWQTGAVPAFVRELKKTDKFYKDIKTIITIHNLRFQGSWGKDYIREVTSLPDEYFGDEQFGYYDSGNLLKGGIVYADSITTVSETYAKEIMMPFYGEGLDGLLAYRSDAVSGIVNGIDYGFFDPETDKFIAHNFSAENFRREKVKNKTALQKELGMNSDRKVMMIGIISRLTDQKGMDLITYMLDELCSDSVQIVVLGTGEEKYESMFRHYEWKYNKDVSVNIKYSEELSHKIYAAADAFLMPSLFEPCGLSQMMAMRYGAVPIVRETGGLKDTVQAYNEYKHTGNGFSFANYNAHEMLGTIRYAERVFYDNKRDWNKIVKEAMTRDYSWTSSALKYVQLYESLTA